MKSVIVLGTGGGARMLLAHIQQTKQLNASHITSLNAYEQEEFFGVPYVPIERAMKGLLSNQPIYIASGYYEEIKESLLSMGMALERIVDGRPLIHMYRHKVEEKLKALFDRNKHLQLLPGRDSACNLVLDKKTCSLYRVFYPHFSEEYRKVFLVIEEEQDLRNLLVQTHESRNLDFINGFVLQHEWIEQVVYPVEWSLAMVWQGVWTTFLLMERLERHNLYIVDPHLWNVLPDNSGQMKFIDYGSIRMGKTPKESMEMFVLSCVGALILANENMQLYRALVTQKREFDASLINFFSRFSFGEHMDKIMSAVERHDVKSFYSHVRVLLRASEVHIGLSELHPPIANGVKEDVQVKNSVLVIGQPKDAIAILTHSEGGEPFVVTSSPESSHDNTRLCIMEWTAPTPAFGSYESDEGLMIYRPVPSYLSPARASAIDRLRSDHVWFIHDIYEEVIRTKLPLSDLVTILNEYVGHYLHINVASASQKIRNLVQEQLRLLGYVKCDCAIESSMESNNLEDTLLNAFAFYTFAKEDE